MRQAFEDLIEFERACGYELSEIGPAIPDKQTKTLRARLITEECSELVTALVDDNLPEIADACADLMYVVLGTCVRYGIDIVPVFDAVHAANLRKFGEGSHRDPVTGKLCKPASWVHPLIAEILLDQDSLSSIYEEIEEEVL